MNKVQQKSSLLVVLCTDLLAGGEIRKCIEQAILPHGIELDYGPNPYLRTGMGDDLAKAPIDFLAHTTNGSPVVGLFNPEARISPVIPQAPLRPWGLNVSILGERGGVIDALGWAIRRQFHLAGCVRMSDTAEDARVENDEAITQALIDANIGIVVVRFLSPKRMMTFEELLPRLAGVRRAPTK